MSNRYSFHDPEDPGERAPLDNPHAPYHHDQQGTPSRNQQQQYRDSPSTSPKRRNHPGAHPDSAFNRSRQARRNSDTRGRAAAVGGDPEAPAPPAHRSNRQSWAPRDAPAGAYRHSTASNITPGADNFGETAVGGMSGLAISVAEKNARQSGLDAMRGYGQQQQGDYGHEYGGQDPYTSHAYRNSYNDASSSSPSLTPMGAAAFPSGRNTPTRSTYSYSSDPFQDPHATYQSRADPSLGQFNPNEIDDDGDDGLEYARPARSSMLSLGSDRDRSHRGGAAAAGAGVGAAVGLSNLTGSNRSGPSYEPVHNASSGYAAGGGGSYDLGGRPEKTAWAAAAKAERAKKKKRMIIIGIVAVVIIAAIVGGVVGAFVMKDKESDSSNGGGLSADEDEAQNGDLNINSSEIQELMNNPNLHKVFPGVDYTPINVQYPECIHNPPSQNNVTRDVAVLSQMTNTIRLYGTDCNQTEMVIHAINQLEMKDDLTIWMGVWQDGNKTTNNRQLEQMWTILDTHGAEYFTGVIVANEVLFREEMTLNQLGNLMETVRQNLTDHGWDLPVATSDLGDDWTTGLAQTSDYIMANIHPFFGGVPAEEAADWTYSFWKNNNGEMWKQDSERNIISEIGWPSGGGKNCADGTANCEPGSVASIDGLNQLLQDWVCEALSKQTNYFWFEMFDEPWKVSFNEPEKNKEWEDKWGLMDVNRNLKDGIKIPDCDGQEVGKPFNKRR